MLQAVSSFEFTGWFSAWPIEKRIADELICAQGIPTKYVFVIEEGMVAFSIKDQSGRESIVATRSSPWVVGTASMLLNKPHMADVRTMSPAKIRIVPADNFREILLNDSKVLWWLCELYSKESLMLATHAAGLGSSTVRERLEEYLFHLSAHCPPGPCRVYFPFKQERVAQLLSTHPGYLSASLKELETAGLIRRNDKGIYIPNGMRPVNWRVSLTG